MKSIRVNKTNVMPNKVICIGRNYVEHIEELGNEMPTEMVIFFKPNSCISDKIKIYDNDTCHYESELSFLILNNKLVAVGFGLDLTKREVQSQLKKRQLPWERAKSFRNSAVFSEFVSFTNIEDLSLELYINDLLVQKGGVDLMINKPMQVLQEVDTFCDIDQHDVLMSGTPKGVGEVTKGDKFVGFVYEKDKMLVKCEWIVS